MSTIGSLLALMDPNIKPWYEVQQGVNREVIGRQQAQTGLIELQQLKEKQAAEQEYLRAIQQNPALAQQLLGGSTIAGLPTTETQPGAAPMMQQSVTPAQPPGAPQVVPGGQDLSQFATQGAPQSVLGSLGPAGQPQGPGQGQPQRNPLLAMAAQNPRAAMMLQSQMQAQQDRQSKLDEQRLGMGVKVAEYVARELQGVTDQASLDAARERVRQVHPQAAAQMPQMYSQEAVASVQQRGIAIAERANTQLAEAKARNLDMETRMFPELAKRFGMEGDAQAPAGDAAPSTATAAPTGRAPQESDATRAIRAEATRQGVDPDLAVAVATQESYLSPNAEGDGGKAKGYFQLHEGAAKDAGIDPARRHEPALNIQGGVGYLKLKLAQAKGNVDEALKLYNGGGDPNYVTNVRRFLPGGTVPAGSTAQAPAADPRIAGLEAKIAQRTRDAKIASLMKNESLSTRLNDEANRLTAEKNRLEAPRQEFLKKQAVAGLEKDIAGEQGRQAAQIKADTEPASKEEIDAVNRSLPPDKRVPYGTTRKQLREQGRVGGELLSPKVTEDLTNTTTAIQQFEELSSAVAQLPTGPLTQYVEGFKERWGIDISDAKVAQRAILAGATNQLLQARSGAAINESEYQRLLKELPNEGNDPKVFKARLANTVRQFKNLYKTKVQILRKLGHAIPDDLMEPLPAPEAPPAPKGSTALDRAREAMKPR